MQTFLPFADYAMCAKVLDDARLNKQRVEAWQVLQTLLGRSTGFDHNPVVRMWRGFEESLCHYGMDICLEWRLRGHLCGLFLRFAEERGRLIVDPDRVCLGDPPWLGDQGLHAAYRAALLCKDPGYYGDLGWVEVPGIDYRWPV